MKDDVAVVPAHARNADGHGGQVARGPGAEKVGSGETGRKQLCYAKFGPANVDLQAASLP